jgi:hypothetical protein
VHNTKEGHYAIRHGKDVLIDAPNGYVSGRNKPWEEQFGYPKEAKTSAQLFDLEKDIAQKQDLSEEQPDKVKRLQALLGKIREEGYPRGK